MRFNRPLVSQIGWCAQCVSRLSRPPDVKIWGLVESQNSILSSLPGKREEMTDVVLNAKLCKEERRVVGETGCKCVPKMFQVRRLISVWVVDREPGLLRPLLDAHTHTHTHPEVQGRTKWWVTQCPIVLLPLPTAASSKPVFWHLFMCLPDTHSSTHTCMLVSLRFIFPASLIWPLISSIFS